MKRVFIAIIVAALAGGGFAAWSLAAPAGGKAPTAKLPPLPAAIKQAKRWRVGVKCDTPPFGYIDLKGQNAGFDVEIARWFSRFAFGRANRVSFTCITTPAREAALQSKRVDLVIATYTWTAARDNLIDFSRAYYKASGT